MPQFSIRNPVLIIIAAVFGLLLLWPVLHNLSSENDFDLFVMTAQRWKLHEPVYENAIIHGRYFYYSPLFLTLMQPFLWLHEVQTDATSMFGGYRWSFISAKAAWSVFNLYIVWYFIKELQQRFRFESQSARIGFGDSRYFLATGGFS